MNCPKSTFAVFFGNRGFFPASLQASARREIGEVLGRLGHRALMLDAELTRHGAVETPQEGGVYARFLQEHRAEVDGVILCLPNFGDETGAVSALQNAGVPILVQAYPDELSQMAPEVRRDAFCGKLSIMDVFCQYGVKFTALKPHTVHISICTPLLGTRLAEDCQTQGLIAVSDLQDFDYYLKRNRAGKLPIALSALSYEQVLQSRSRILKRRRLRVMADNLRELGRDFLRDPDLGKFIFRYSFYRKMRHYFG